MGNPYLSRQTREDFANRLKTLIWEVRVENIKREAEGPEGFGWDVNKRSSLKGELETIAQEVEKAVSGKLALKDTVKELLALLSDARKFGMMQIERETKSLSDLLDRADLEWPSKSMLRKYRKELDQLKKDARRLLATSADPEETKRLEDLLSRIREEQALLNNEKAAKNSAPWRRIQARMNDIYAEVYDRTEKGGWILGAKSKEVAKERLDELTDELRGLEKQIRSLVTENVAADLQSRVETSRERLLDDLSGSAISVGWINAAIGYDLVDPSSKPDMKWFTGGEMEWIDEAVAGERSVWDVVYEKIAPYLTGSAKKDLEESLKRKDREGLQRYEDLLYFALKVCLLKAAGQGTADIAAQLEKFRLKLNAVNEAKIKNVLEGLGGSDDAADEKAAQWLIDNLDDSVDQLKSKHGLTREHLRGARVNFEMGTIELEPSKFRTPFFVDKSGTAVSSAFGRHQDYLRFTFMASTPDHQALDDITTTHEQEGHRYENLHQEDYDGKILDSLRRGDSEIARLSTEQKKTWMRQWIESRLKGELHAFGIEVYAHFAIMSASDAEKQLKLWKKFWKEKKEILKGSTYLKNFIGRALKETGLSEDENMKKWEKKYTEEMEWVLDSAVEEIIKRQPLMVLKGGEQFRSGPYRFDVQAYHDWILNTPIGRIAAAQRAKSPIGEIIEKHPEFEGRKKAEIAKLQKHAGTMRGLFEVPGQSGDEGRVIARVLEILKANNIAYKPLRRDGRLTDEHGNLLIKIEATDKDLATVLLSAHADVVEQVKSGASYWDKDGVLRPAVAGSALGADNRAWLASVLHIITELVNSKRPHGEIRLAVSTREEIGVGIGSADPSILENVRYAIFGDSQADYMENKKDFYGRTKFTRELADHAIYYGNDGLRMMLEEISGWPADGKMPVTDGFRAGALGKFADRAGDFWKVMRMRYPDLNEEQLMEKVKNPQPEDLQVINFFDGGRGPHTAGESNDIFANIRMTEMALRLLERIWAPAARPELRMAEEAEVRAPEVRTELRLAPGGESAKPAAPQVVEPGKKLEVPAAITDALARIGAEGRAAESRSLAAKLTAQLESFTAAGGKIYAVTPGAPAVDDRERAAKFTEGQLGYFNATKNEIVLNMDALKTFAANGAMPANWGDAQDVLAENIAFVLTHELAHAEGAEARALFRQTAPQVAEALEEYFLTLPAMRDAAGISERFGFMRSKIDALMKMLANPRDYADALTVMQSVAKQLGVETLIPMLGGETILAGELAKKTSPLAGLAPDFTLLENIAQLKSRLFAVRKVTPDNYIVIAVKQSEAEAVRQILESPEIDFKGGLHLIAEDEDLKDAKASVAAMRGIGVVGWAEIAKDARMELRGGQLMSNLRRLSNFLQNLVADVLQAFAVGKSA